MFKFLHHDDDNADVDYDAEATTSLRSFLLEKKKMQIPLPQSAEQHHDANFECYRIPRLRKETIIVAMITFFSECFFFNSQKPVAKSGPNKIWIGTLAVIMLSTELCVDQHKSFL